MRKHLSPRYFGRWLSAVSVLFFSCNKSNDWKGKESHFGEPIEVCQVSTITFDNDPAAIVAFQYNSKGDPESIKQVGKQLPVPLDYYFRYDKYDRLSDYIITFYQMTGAFVWHRYSYPAANIIVDSQFNYVGLVTDPEPPHSSPTYSVNRLTLDKYGRIIKSTDLATNIEQDFQYDVAGNLTIPGVTYDNKLNLYHTSKTWMLIYKDFSLNNPITSTAKITKYNNYGLPTQFESTDPNASVYLFGYRYNFATVAFNCDVSAVRKE